MPFVSAEDVEQTIAFYQKAASGVTQRYQTKAVHKNGSVVYVDVTNMPIIINDEVVGVYGVAKDITDRYLEQDELRKTKERLESFVRNNADAIWVIDLEERVLEINPAFETMFGWTKEEILGVHLYDLPFIPPEILADKRQAVEMDQQKPILGLETVRYRKDGAVLDVAFSKFPVYDAEGKMDGWSVILRDITEWKKSQLMLQNSEKLTVAGQLAAGIAHEIRNPITVIKGFIYLMKSGFGDKEEYFNIMSSECERIEQILTELLVLAKPHPSKVEPRDIRLIMMQTITLLHTQAIMNNVEIVTEFQQGVPVVYCDENQMKQVFINFMKNAIEAMQKGGKLIIQIKQTEDEKIMVRFIDEGTGIPKEVLNKMGQPLHTTKEKGTGLGFMVSKKIIENHSGEVHIKSEWNKGTTLEIRLPVTKGAVEASAKLRS
ncbi:PAS domain S-box protein [Brevibacillus centrosporus]|uniref:PAS domain S-box protein n=1 Tax=Brevibacillus centrosporus TaxID=54910 RepID=UPI003D1B7FEE